MRWSNPSRSSVAEISRPTSSSAAVSRARRCVSRYSCAFRMAVPTFEAIVERSRASASPNRPSSSMLWTLTTPIASSADEDRNAEVGLHGRPDALALHDLEVLGTVQQERLARLEDPRGQALAEPQRLAGRRLPPLDPVREIDHARHSVEQRHIDDVRSERRPELLAGELDEAVEVELRGRRLPDVVDDRQLGWRVAGSRRRGARSPVRRSGSTRVS